MVKEYCDNIKLLWPEIVRILMLSSMFDFEADDSTEDLADKLVGVTPTSFHSALTYEEKVKILIFLVNTTHDLQGFRDSMND